MNHSPEHDHEPHRWRGTLHPIDPDTVSRSVRIAGGLCSWDNPPHTYYQLGTTSLDLHETPEGSTLLMTDTTAEHVRNTTARLGYHHDDLHLQHRPASTTPPTPKHAQTRKTGQ